MIYCVLPPSLYCSIHKLNYKKREREKKYVIFLFSFQAAASAVQYRPINGLKELAIATWYAGDVGDDVVRDWREHLLPPLFYNLLLRLRIILL